MFVYPVRVPAAARAQIDYASQQADEAFQTMRQASLVSDGDGGFFERPEDDDQRDAAVVDGLRGVVIEIGAVLSRIAQRDQWSAGELARIVDDLVDQRIVWVYRQQHSRRISLAQFLDAMHATINARSDNEPKLSAVSRPAFPRRAQWLREQMQRADNLTPRGLETHGGPNHKTTQRILAGAATRDDVLHKVVNALRDAGCKVTFDEIPRN